MQPTIILYRKQISRKSPTDSVQFAYVKFAAQPSKKNRAQQSGRCSVPVATALK